MRKQESNTHYDALYYKDKQRLPEYLLKSIDIILKENNVNSVLEVGCGAGALLGFLKSQGYHAWGSDISFDAAKMSGQVNADACRVPLKDASVDCVIAISLIEHLSLADGKLFLKEVRRVTKDNGMIFLVTPNKASLKSTIFGAERMHTADPSHVFFYSPGSLSRELKNAGFSETRCLFSFPKNCSLEGWSMPRVIQKTGIQCIKDMGNWIFISSVVALIRDSFWILGKKSNNLR